jgi:hypothetical protein
MPQAVKVTKVHTPVRAQQVPGVGQSLGVQTPASVHVAGLGHEASSEIEQVPAAEQQEPGWGHSLGLHVPPGVHVPPFVQAMKSPTEHAPAVEQHAPEPAEQGLGEQVVPV